MSSSEASSAPSPAPAAPAASPAPAPKESFWGIIRDVYLSFDRRTLGFARIMLGFLLVMDLIRRTPDWVDVFSTEGVLPNHVNLLRPQGGGNFSIVNAFSTPGELWVLWAVELFCFLGLLVGYRTRVFQILSLIFVTSNNGRVLLFENGGYVVQNLLLLWTCFLPMGDRFSLDAMLESMRRKRETTEDELNDRSNLIDSRKLEPFISFVGLVIMLQISAIYYFNVVHKTGPAWKNGTAVHYVLYVDRMITPLIADIRHLSPPWLIIFLTKFVLFAEAAIPICLLSPLGRTWARRITIVLMNTLHLGFGSFFVLGPFAWSACVFSTLLFTTDDWELAIRTMWRSHRARTVLYNPKSAAQFWACRLLARMDRFELLYFCADESQSQGLAIEDPNDPNKVISGSLALSGIIAALPLGPAIAWTFRLPIVRPIADALTQRWDMARTFGMRLPRKGSEEQEPSPLRRWMRKPAMVLRELIVIAMFAGAVNQALTELWVVNRRYKVPQPEALRLLSHKLRFLQGWFMFSPNPVMDDGTIVVDAITVDGRHIDPFTGKEPFWDLSHVKSLGLNQIWCDYFNRMHLSQNAPFRDAMKEYMLRLPERTGRPEDTIVSGEVYWVQDLNPKWRETQSYKYEKQKLFSFDNPKAKARAQNP